jgi:hypothetical protein
MIMPYQCPPLAIHSTFRLTHDISEAEIMSCMLRLWHNPDPAMYNVAGDIAIHAFPENHPVTKLGLGRRQRPRRPLGIFARAVASRLDITSNAYLMIIGIHFTFPRELQAERRRGILITMGIL